ncbi:hypothetical protein AYI68_g2934, partial [Smittium mucronatum]
MIKLVLTITFALTCSNHAVADTFISTALDSSTHLDSPTSISYSHTHHHLHLSRFFNNADRSHTNSSVPTQVSHISGSTNPTFKQLKPTPNQIKPKLTKIKLVPKQFKSVPQKTKPASKNIKPKLKVIKSVQKHNKPIPKHINAVSNKNKPISKKINSAPNQKTPAKIQISPTVTRTNPPKNIRKNPSFTPIKKNPNPKLLPKPQHKNTHPPPVSHTNPPTVPNNIPVGPTQNLVEYAQPYGEYRDSNPVAYSTTAITARTDWNGPVVPYYTERNEAIPLGLIHTALIYAHRFPHTLDPDTAPDISDFSSLSAVNNRVTPTTTLDLNLNYPLTTGLYHHFSNESTIIIDTHITNEFKFSGSVHGRDPNGVYPDGDLGWVYPYNDIITANSITPDHYSSQMDGPSHHTPISSTLNIDITRTDDVYVGEIVHGRDPNGVYPDGDLDWVYPYNDIIANDSKISDQYTSQTDDLLQYIPNPHTLSSFITRTNVNDVGELPSFEDSNEIHSNSDPDKTYSNSDSNISKIPPNYIFEHESSTINPTVTLPSNLLTEADLPLS